MTKLLFATDRSTTSKLSAQTKAGKLKKLYHGIYTADLSTPIEQIIHKNWLQIMAHIVPDGVLSFRTAHDLRPIPFAERHVAFVTSSYAKTIILPGLEIKVIKGDKEHFTEQVLPNIARSDEARMLLENLATTKGTYKTIKTIGPEGVELYLAKRLHNGNEAILNAIRDAAKHTAQALSMQTEYQKLTKIIGSLLATNSAENLSTSYAKALVKKEPFDSYRLEMFTNLSLFLQKNSFLPREYVYDRQGFKNLSFFEAYFSNYIEGTKFHLEEAEDIVFTGKLIAHRHADSHDVLELFRITNDYLGMSQTPQNAKEFIEILQSRHATLLHERPDIDPGHFKTRGNHAGSTIFVEPQDVMGTLTRAFELYALLEDGMKKAIFMHFIVSEVHPFNDGNGRISRLMMNAELVKAQQTKIIVPIVYRDSYMDALRVASREQHFQPFCRAMDVAQAYTASVPWSDYLATRDKIELDAAMLEADEGLAKFNRLIRQLKLSVLG